MPVPVLTDRPVATDRSAFWVTISDRVGRALYLDTVGRPGSPYLLRPGVTGLDMPTVSLSSDALPDEDGSILRALRFVERDIFLPIWVAGRSYDEQRGRTQALFALLNPRKSSNPYDERNLVDIEVAQPDGTRRVVSGYYVGGAEGSYTSAEFGIEWRVVGVTIRCLDPYWYDAEPLSIPFPLPQAPKDFLSDPFFPIRLGSSQVLGAVTIPNPGDVDAFAVFDVDGPGDSFTATNTTTGRTFTVDQVLDADTRLTVDARRLHQTVQDQDGTNLFASLTGDLWPLQPGYNHVTLVVPSATTDTLVTATIYVRHLSA